MTTTTRTVRNGEIDIAVYEEGNPDGQTVVLVHGWPDTHHLWRNVAPLLAARFRVVSYDVRGAGRSTNPKRTKDFTVAELAADFRAVVDAVSPDEPVHVLAHDWGSVAVWDAVCEPGAEQRIASFTSCSGPNTDHISHWFRDRLSRPTPRNVAQPLSQLAHFSYMLFFASPVLPRLAFRIGFTPRVWRRILSRREGIPVDQVHLADTFRDDAVNGLRIYRANSVQSLGKPRDRHTAVPVQLIVSSDDPAVLPHSYDDTPQWTQRLYRRNIHAGHWTPFSHPEMLANAATELIDALSGQPPARALRRAERVAERDGREFDEQLVVVTGGGSGIGRETALAFARDGAEIVVCDVNLDAAKETAVMVEDAGSTAHAYLLDVSDEAAVQAFAAEVTERHGVPDVLVNNAGIGHAGKFLATSSEDFQRVMDVNFNGVVYGCRAFAPRMVAQGTGGHIVNLSSAAAFTPMKAFGPYASSKSAVFMFSDCLRAELAPAGVGVTTVCPGIVHTNITATTHFSGVSAEDEARKQAKADRLYRRRGYTPDKVARQIVKAVRRKQDVLPVTPEAYQAYYTRRFAPGLTRRMARSNVIDSL